MRLVRSRVSVNRVADPVAPACACALLFVASLGVVGGGGVVGGVYGVSYPYDEPAIMRRLLSDVNDGRRRATVVGPVKQTTVLPTFHCLMVHGVGVTGSAPVSRTMQPPGYWGAALHDQ